MSPCHAGRKKNNNTQDLKANSARRAGGYPQLGDYSRDHQEDWAEETPHQIAPKRTVREHLPVTLKPNLEIVRHQKLKGGSSRKSRLLKILPKGQGVENTPCKHKQTQTMQISNHDGNIE